MVAIRHPWRSLLATLLRLPPPRSSVRVKRDIPVPMPDGVRLLADHYYPATAGDWPTVLIRTPYGRGKEVALGGGYAMSELPAQRFAERNYHVIVQGARGCLDSEGEFTPHINEAADGLATVKWITQQPWFNGTLGTWGPSYLGYMQWAIAAAQPPSLKAMVPMVTSAENFSVTHPDGAFGLETRLRWSQGIVTMRSDHGRPLWSQLIGRFSKQRAQDLQAAFDCLPLLEGDAVAAGEPIPFYRQLLAQDQPAAPYWSARDHSAAVAQVSAPVHLIGGWYDYYLRGLLRDYASLRAVGRRPHLTIGPWSHADPGGLMTGLRQGVAWFEAHLKGDSSRLEPMPVRIYLLGADSWQELDDFPPPTRQARYYLHPDAALSTAQPQGAMPPDRYRYDPADPTPVLGGALLAFRGAGPQDNRPLEARSDVLCYTTPPLAAPVEIIGPVQLELYVRSSLAYTDFFGRLCNVAPDGRSTNICDGLVRIQPGRGIVQADGSLMVQVDMWATACRFKRGHRLRLQVSSGAHPRWSRNLGTGEPLGSGSTTAVAEQAIYHDAAHPSALVLPLYDS